MDGNERVAFTIRLISVVDARGKGDSLDADSARWICAHWHCQGMAPCPTMIERDIEHIVNGAIRVHDIGASDQMARLLWVGSDLGLVMLERGLRATYLHVWTDYVRRRDVRNGTEVRDQREEE